jgi:GNAT superfamily N-acetyltransferase
MSDFTVKTIRTLEQLQQVYAFAVPIFNLPTGQHTLEHYTEQWARAPQLLVFAERDDRICGCILAGIEGDHILVGPVAVAADSRRLGIGSAMMREVETQAKALGQHTLILGAREEAEPFYLSCGFRPNLFIQLPEPEAVARLKALNEQYEVEWEEEREGWSKLMLRTPQIDKPLQRTYEQVFPGCFTQYVFIKQV